MGVAAKTGEAERGQQPATARGAAALGPAWGNQAMARLARTNGVTGTAEPEATDEGSEPLDLDVEDLIETPPATPGQAADGPAATGTPSPDGGGGAEMETAIARLEAALANESAGGGTPAAEETATSPAEQTATPPAEQTATPAAEQTATPPAEQTATPPAEQTATPSAEQSATAPGEQTATPATAQAGPDTLQQGLAAAAAERRRGPGSRQPKSPLPDHPFPENVAAMNAQADAEIRQRQLEPVKAAAAAVLAQLQAAGSHPPNAARLQGHVAALTTIVSGAHGGEPPQQQGLVDAAQAELALVATAGEQAKAAALARIDAAPVVAAYAFMARLRTRIAKADPVTGAALIAKLDAEAQALLAQAAGPVAALEALVSAVTQQGREAVAYLRRQVEEKAFGTLADNLEARQHIDRIAALLEDRHTVALADLPKHQQKLETALATVSGKLVDRAVLPKIQQVGPVADVALAAIAPVRQQKDALYQQLQALPHNPPPPQRAAVKAQREALKQQIAEAKARIIQLGAPLEQAKAAVRAELQPLLEVGLLRRGKLESAYRQGPHGSGQYGAEWTLAGTNRLVVHSHMGASGHANDAEATHVKLRGEKLQGGSKNVSLPAGYGGDTLMDPAVNAAKIATL